VVKLARQQRIALRRTHVMKSEVAEMSKRWGSKRRREERRKK
jgi:hypothetical protein